MTVAYFIVTYGDAQGGSRDDYRRCTEEEYRTYVDPSGWSKAIRVIEPEDQRTEHGWKID